ncbi:MAG: class I adenylate-forming enzyme family protein [Chloroflexota bacterium]
MLYDNDILNGLYDKAHHPDYAERIAVQQVDGVRLTYAELMHKVDNLAKNLIARGFVAGDRALLLVRPSVDTMILVLGIVRAGGAVIIGDIAMGKDVFESRVRTAQPKWVFAESILLLLQQWSWLRGIAKGRGLDVPEMNNLGAVTVINVGNIPFLGNVNLSKLTNDSDMNSTTQRRDPSSDLMIIFTSGTTGQPKGVVHTLASTIATLNRVRQYLALTEHDVLYTYALHLTIPVLSAGGKAVLPSTNNSPEKTLNAYQDYGITKTFDVPANIQQLLTILHERGETLPNTLQTILLGAAPVFPDLLARLQQFAHDNLRVYAIYGMTEMLPACAVSLEDKLTFNPTQGDIIGTPLDGVNYRLADDGELILSGDGLYDRYLGQTPVSEHLTGDIATEIDGHLVLLGRKKDMIIRGNYNVYPLLFEPTIRQIDNVQDCAMVGVYNPAKADEDIILFIDGDISESNLRKALLTGTHSIDQYAHPDYIIYMQIPRSGRSDKIDRQALRQLAHEQLDIHNVTPTLEPVS